MARTKQYARKLKHGHMNHRSVAAVDLSRISFNAHINHKEIFKGVLAAIIASNSVNPVTKTLALFIAEKGYFTSLEHFEEYIDVLKTLSTSMVDLPKMTARAFADSLILTCNILRDQSISGRIVPFCTDDVILAYILSIIKSHFSWLEEGNTLLHEFVTLLQALFKANPALGFDETLQGFSAIIEATRDSVRTFAETHKVYKNTLATRKYAMLSIANSSPTTNVGKVAKAINSAPDDTLNPRKAQFYKFMELVCEFIDNKATFSAGAIVDATLRLFSKLKKVPGLVNSRLKEIRGKYPAAADTDENRCCEQILLDLVPQLPPASADVLIVTHLASNRRSKTLVLYFKQATYQTALHQMKAIAVKLPELSLTDIVDAVIEIGAQVRKIIQKGVPITSLGNGGANLLLDGADGNADEDDVEECVDGEEESAHSGDSDSDGDSDSEFETSFSRRWSKSAAGAREAQEDAPSSKRTRVIPAEEAQSSSAVGSSSAVQVTRGVQQLALEEAESGQGLAQTPVQDQEEIDEVEIVD